MHDLNDALDELRAVIPYAHGPSVRKLSKIATLLLAKNYILMQARALDELRRLVGYINHSAAAGAAAAGVAAVHQAGVSPVAACRPPLPPSHQAGSLSSSIPGAGHQLSAGPFDPFSRSSPSSPSASATIAEGATMAPVAAAAAGSSIGIRGIQQQQPGTSYGLLSANDSSSPGISSGPSINTGSAESCPAGLRAM
jgi:hypothetical protein